MHELEAKLKPILEMKEKLTEWSKSELEKGKEQVDTAEMGQVVDMIKDLAEAEEKCIKGAYYKCLLKEKKDDEEMQKMMEKMGGEGGMGYNRMGYDNYRYSSGRFAPKGRGSYRPGESGRSGYPMEWEEDPSMMAEGWWDGMMGYRGQGGGGSSGGRGGNSGGSQGGSGRGGNSGGGSQGGSSGGSGSSGYTENYGYNGGGQGGGSSQGGNSSGSSGSGGRGGSGGSSGGRMGYSDQDMERYFHDERHGKPYRDWQMSRRHYTETKSEGDKKEMSEHAKEHMSDMVMTVKEMWGDADPQLKEQMKKDLTALMAEMK